MQVGECTIDSLDSYLLICQLVEEQGIVHAVHVAAHAVQKSCNHEPAILTDTPCVNTSCAYLPFLAERPVQKIQKGIEV